MLASSLLLIGLFLNAQAGPALQLTISGAGSFAGVENAIVRATLANTGDEVARILNAPNTILSKMETNKFIISNTEGVSPQFTGKLVKYLPTVNSEHIILVPGESVALEHKLADTYDFTRSGAGKYSIEASSAFTLITGGGLETIYAETKAHMARLTGELYKPCQKLSRRATFAGCTSARQTSITTAYVGAQGYADEAYAYLLNHTSSTSRYTTWFGIWTSTRYQTVLSRFQKLSAHAASSNLYDCTCTDSADAYTYASVTGQIWLCNGFWSAPTLGTDSQAGVIIYKSLYWNTIAGIGDIVYGQSAAKALAISNPNSAIDNAKSYEYFAENTPTQS